MRHHTPVSSRRQDKDATVATRRDNPPPPDKISDSLIITGVRRIALQIWSGLGVQAVPDTQAGVSVVSPDIGWGTSGDSDTLCDISRALCRYIDGVVTCPRFQLKLW